MMVVFYFKSAPWINCKEGGFHWIGGDSAVWGGGGFEAFFTLHPAQPINKQPLECTSNWITSFEQVKLIFPVSCPDAVWFFFSRYLSSLSHTELMRENKRAELISAGPPGEIEAKGAINNIFIHPYPFVLLGELSQRSLSKWESNGMKTWTHTQC